MIAKLPKNILKRLKKPDRNYIVVDFEWNQALRRNSPVFNRLPIHLGGEIIEIGAVKLRGDFSPGEEFTMDVRPVYFKQMHFKVRKITGIDSERLHKARFFPQALEKFREWAGDDAVFLTWGSDDRSIFEQNVIVHDLDYDWISDWINLQVIYNMQTDGDKNQKALETAMEYFSIPQTRQAHDALGDAYNTAKVAYNLDLEKGLEMYEKGKTVLSGKVAHAQEKAAAAMTSKEPSEDALLHDAFPGYESKAEAFNDERVSKLKCPDCGQDCSSSRWVNQGDGRYMNLYTCPEHGKFLMRLRFKKGEDGLLCANRLVYRADKSMMDFYKNKANLARRHSRSGGRSVKRTSSVTRE